MGNAQLQLAAYLLSVLVHHDRGIRVIGPPRSRQEWGIGRIGDYLRAIGREAIMEGGEVEIWALLRESVALLPFRREEALLRLIRVLAPLEGWLDDQDIPAPTKPTKYRLPAA
jgi:hypothetical protein